MIRLIAEYKNLGAGRTEEVRELAGCDLIVNINSFCIEQLMLNCPLQLILGTLCYFLYNDESTDD